MIVVGSDGLRENLPGNDMLYAVREALGAYDDPESVAKNLVDTAIGSNLKDDDISCCVGIVRAKDAV